MTAGRGWIALALVVFRVVAAGTAGGRRLSVRRSDDPAAACAGSRFRHPVATDVVAAVSRDHRGAGRDLAVRAALPGPPRPHRSVWCSCPTVDRPPERARTGRALRRQFEPPVRERGVRHAKDAALWPPQLAARRGRRKRHDASAQSKLKVGFIYLGPVGDFGWTYQHEVGRQARREGARRQGRRRRTWRTSTRVRTPSARSSNWRAPATS